MNEHLNGTSFEEVRMYASQKPSTWDVYLDALTFAYRNTPHSVTQHTPAFLMFGGECTSHLKPPTRLCADDPVKVVQNTRQQAYAIVKDLVAKEQKRQKKYHDQNVKEIQIKEDDKVWLRDFIVKAGTSKTFHQPWKGPYKVVRDVGKNNVDIELNTGKIKRVNLEQIKLVTKIDGSP